MIKNVIRHNDNIYIINRTLPSSTSEESANRIHNVLGTDTLLRDSNGNWFCCNSAKEVSFRDIEKPKVDSEQYGHYGFELQDNGGLG